MALAGALEIQLTADIARLKTDMAQVKTLVGGTAKDMESAFNSVGSAVGKLQNLLGALGVGASIGGLVMLGKAAIDAADHINDLTKSTGLAVEELAGLGIAAKQSGADLNSVADGITKMSQNMGKNADMFKALGITAKEPLEAFKQAADMFAALGTEQEKAAFGLMVFGKSWATMAPLLAEGGKKIGEMTEEGKKLSGMTKELALQADDFNDKMVKLTGTGSAMNTVLDATLPLLNKMASDMLELSKNTEGASASNNVFTESLKGIALVLGTVSYFFVAVGKDLGALIAKAEALLRLDWKAIKAITSERTADAEKAALAYVKWAKSIMDVGTAAQETAKKLIEMRNADPDVQREATAAAAKARAEAKAAGEALAAAQNLEKAKREGAAADKARQAELDRLQKLADKSYAEFQAAKEKQRDEQIDADAAERARQRKENEELLALGLKGEQEAAIKRQELRDEELKLVSDFELKKRKESDEAKAKELEAIQKQWAEIDAFAFDAFESMFEKGTDTWKQLGESLKKTMIRALYELTVQKWTLQLFANLTGQTPGAITGQGGDAMSSANLAASGLSLTGVSTAGALSAYTGVVGSGATAAGLGAGAAAEIGSAAAGAVVGAEAISAAAAAVIPVIGWVVAAAALVYALYSANKEPAQVRGGLGFQGPFEDQAAPTRTPFGDIGFSDAATQQFSGQVGKAFTDAIGALLTAGAAQLTPEAVDDVTKQMHDTILLSAEGTFTTEEFLSKFGPDMARQLLDPMLEAVDPYARELVDTFEGPLQELLNLAADVLAVTGALSSRGEEFTAIFGEVIDLQALEAMRGEGETFTATLNRLTVEFTATNAVAVLFGKTQEETWGAVGLASEEARAQLIEFSGGIDNLNASLNSYYDHYFTAEEKKKMQQDDLAESFRKLNVEMPTTLEGFRDLIEKTGVKTEADRQQTAGLLKLEGRLYNLITATDTATKAVEDNTAAQQAQADAARRAAEVAREQTDLDIQLAALKAPWAAKDAERARQWEAAKSEEARTTLVAIFHEQDLAQARNEAAAATQRAAAEEAERQRKEEQAAKTTASLEDRLAVARGESTQKNMDRWHEWAAATSVADRRLLEEIWRTEDLAEAAKDASKNIGDLAESIQGIPAEWQFLWHGPGPNDGEWVNQMGVHSTYPGLPADQGGAAGIEDQRLALLAQIYDLLGDKVNALVVLEIQRTLALQKMAPELRALQTQLWGLQDAAEAAAKALEFEQTKRQLLIQITRAQGWEEAARDMERADQLAAINKEYGEGTVQAQELITLYQQLWWAQDHAAQSGNDMLEWVKSLQDWLRALTLDETLSPLTARQRFAYAQEQYVEALMGAQGGDAEARARFTETADAYLRESLSMFGRASNDYNAIYNAIVAQTEGLIAQGLGPAAPVTMGDLNVTLLQGQQTAAEQMSALLAKVDNLVEATTDGSDTVARSVQNIPLPTAPLA